ncbi:hypothetical protein KP509_02G092000 [Ceratopteris richardii]|nr:hypothetical protein KP509_02G092000 [Ceratopteris richardii]
MSLDGRGRQHLRLKNSFNRRTKSQGTLLDAEHLGVCEEPWEEAPKLVTNNSEPYTHLQASASASSSAIERPVNANKPAEKKSASKSAKKWAFKDFLRRTVPSSKADAHYINKTLGAQFSVKSFFSSSKHTCSTEASDLAPPLNVDSNQPTLTNAKLQPSQPSRSSSPHSESTHGSTHTKHPVEVSSKAQKPSIPSRVSTPSSPRSPLLSYVAHYKQQKAKSQELGRKTFLPYRQSLLSCLGANKPVPRGNLVW